MILPDPIRLLKRTFGFLSIGLTIWLSCSAQVRQSSAKSVPPDAAPSGSTVKGHVVYEDSDRPVRRAQIALLQSAENSREFSATTDRDGRFIVGAVPAGIYFVVVNSPGIITPFAFMKITEDRPPQGLNRKEIKDYCTEVSVDGATDIDVTVHARRGGVISGKVTYQDGEPAVNAGVSILRRVAGKYEPVLTGINSSSLLALHTDDRGVYRVSALPPGEYIVSAAESNTSNGNRRGGFGAGLDDLFSTSDALVASYYGGTTSMKDAVTIKVNANSEIGNIDIALPEVTLHTVSGKVVAHLDNLVLPAATIKVRNKDLPNLFGQEARNLQTDNEGRWMLDGVPDGSYLFRVEPPYNFPAPGADRVPNDDDEEAPMQQKVPSRHFVPQETEVTISGSDVGGIIIALAEGASISGTVELPNELRKDSIGYTQVRWTYEGEILSPYGNSTGAYDGNFSIDGLRAGKIRLSAEVSMRGIHDDESAKYYVKSITLNGDDLTKTPLTVSEGQSIRNVHILISSDAARATLQLLDEKGKPVPAKPIAVVPVEESKWLFQTETVRATSDSKGLIPFTGAPGEYLIVVAEPDDPWPPSADLIRSRAAIAQHVTFHSGDNKTLTVTLPTRQISP